MANNHVDDAGDGMLRRSCDRSHAQSLLLFGDSPQRVFFRMFIVIFAATAHPTVGSNIPSTVFCSSPTRSQIMMNRRLSSYIPSPTKGLEIGVARLLLSNQKKTQHPAVNTVTEQAVTFVESSPTSSSTSSENFRIPSIPSGHFRKMWKDLAPVSRRKFEVEPYHDIKGNIKLNTVKHTAPMEVEVVSSKKISGPKALGDVYQVVLNHDGKFPFWEGQSLGVVTPGFNPRTGKPNAVRLYSIASTRYGDDFQGKTVTLCVRRAIFRDPETGAVDETKTGLCSNLLCHSKPGDKFKIVGPSGKVMLIPEDQPKKDIIMVATGTGVAPYRGFWRRLFNERTPAASAFKGLAWLFFGGANSDSILFADEMERLLSRHGIGNSYGLPERFRLTTALSREGGEAVHPDGSRMYVQHRIEEHASEVFNRMMNGAHMYFCGLKGMMPGIDETMQRIAKEHRLNWDDVRQQWRDNGQWHVEVY